MAYITKRGKRWFVRVTAFDKNGTRIQPSATFDTKKEAEYWASKNEVRKFEGDSLTQTKQTFVEYFESWYQLYKEPKVRKATKAWYAATKKVIQQNFGETKLAEITREQYQAFLNHIGTIYVQSSCQKMHGHIRASILSAIDNDKLRKDFTAHAVVTGLKPDSEVLRYLNAHEMAELIRITKQHLRPKAMGRYMILTALYTGCRLAEIGGLTWSDINFNFKTLTVSKTYDYKSKYQPTDPDPAHVFADTKNYQSKRTIRINDELLMFFRLLRDQQDSVLHKLHIENPHDLVFLNDLGTIPTSTAVNKLLRGFLAQIDGIRPEVLELNFHGLRHTHASYLLYKKVSIYYISQRLGHKNISTTLKTYAHVINELEHEESEKALAALSEVVPPESIIPKKIHA